MPTTTDVDDIILRNMVRWLMFAVNPSGLGVGADNWLGLLDDTDTELTGGGYTRIETVVSWSDPFLTWEAISVSDFTFTNLPAVTVEKVAFYSAASGGAPTMTIAITPIALTAGDDIEILANDLSIEFIPTGDINTLGDFDGHPRMILTQSSFAGLPHTRRFDLYDSGVPVSDTHYTLWDLFEQNGGDFTDPTTGYTESQLKWIDYDSAGGFTVDEWRLGDGTDDYVTSNAIAVTPAAGDVLQIAAPDFVCEIVGYP